jgi:hypothetical protein
MDVVAGKRVAVNRTSATLLLGIAIGAVGVLLLERFKEVLHEEDPDDLADRLVKNIQALEDRMAVAATSSR